MYYMYIYGLILGVCGLLNIYSPGQMVIMAQPQLDGCGLQVDSFADALGDWVWCHVLDLESDN